MNVLRKPFTIVSLSSSTNWTLHGLRSSTVIGFAQRTLPLIDISLSRFTIVIPLLYMLVAKKKKNAYDVNQVYQSEIKAQQTFVTVKLMSWLVKFIVKNFSRVRIIRAIPGEPRKRAAKRCFMRSLSKIYLRNRFIINEHRVGFVTIVNTSHETFLDDKSSSYPLERVQRSLADNNTDCVRRLKVSGNVSPFRWTRFLCETQSFESLFNETLYNSSRYIFRFIMIGNIVLSIGFWHVELHMLML